MSECRVQLRRNTTDTAWGFRLQGGHDFNSPLVVQRVFSGSPSDGQLQRGDVLVSINNKDVGHMQQKQAEDFVKTTGTSLSIVVKRSAGGLQLNNVPVQQPQYSNEPSQPVHTMQDGGSNQYRPPPPSSLNASDGFSQPKKYSPQNVWTPSAAASYPAPESPQRGGGGYGGYDQQQPATQKYQPVSFQKPVSPAGYGGTGNQFSTDSPRYETAPKGGAGSSWRGPSGGGPARQEQPSQVPLPVQHEYSNQGHPAPAPRFLDEMPPQSIQPTVIGQQEGDEEDYEPKSVREIKAMFNKSPKPVGQQRSSNKPIKFQPKPAPAVSHQQPSWNASPAGRQVSYQQSRAFSPPSQPVEQRGSVLSPQQDPYSRGWPSLSPPPAAQPVTGLLKPKTVGGSIKPGAGYSYQGIVSVTPPKKVHQGSKSQGSRSGSGPAKKKEFDPAQSLVLQMLQEENERAKRGETGPAEEEYREPPAAPGQARGRRPQMQQPQPQVPQQQGGSSRLQELLERDRALAQQQEESEHQPPPSQPQYHQQQQQQQYHQPQQQRIPQQQQQSYQAGGSTARQQAAAPNYAQPRQQPSGGYQSYQNEPQYDGGYQQQSATSHGNNYQQGGGASPRDYYQSYDDGVPISDF